MNMPKNVVYLKNSEDAKQFGETLKCFFKAKEIAQMFGLKYTCNAFAYRSGKMHITKKHTEAFELAVTAKREALLAAKGLALDNCKHQNDTSS